MPQATSCTGLGRHFPMPVLLTACSIATPVMLRRLLFWRSSPRFSRKRDTAHSLLAVKILHTGLHYLEECFTYKKVLFKTFCRSLKTQLLSSWKGYCNPCYKAHATPHDHSPGIKWQASLRTSSKVVRVTDAPNLMPSVVCFTAFNSWMWVGAIRTG